MVDAVRLNDRRATLEALRDRLAEIIDSTESGRDIAALSKRLMEVEREIESLPDEGGEPSPLDRVVRART